MAFLPSHTIQSTTRKPPARLICSTLPAEISRPLKTTPLQPLQKTTIYYLIPYKLPYQSPTKHPSDNDTLLLALSLNHTSWLRSRYIRTKAFLKETRLQQRIYRGLHGTPGRTGLDAPTKPKNLPTGIAYLNNRIFAFGTNLPWRISPRDLVTFGESAIGDVLTDGPLIDIRGTELTHLCTYGAVPWLLTIARNPSGKVLRSFLGRYGDTAKSFRIDGFRGREIAVFEDGVLVVGWNTDDVGGFGGLMKGLFGGTDTTFVDRSSEVLLIRSGQVVFRGSVQGVLTSISAIENSDGGVTVLAKRVLGEGVSLTTLEDIRSGTAFVNQDDVVVKSSLVGFDIKDGAIGQIRNTSEDDVLVMDMAKVYDMKNRGTVYIGYGCTSRRIGLYDLHDGCWEIDDGILSGALYRPDHTHLSVIHTQPESPPKILFFQTKNIPAGPIAEVVLEGLEDINTSINGIWTNLNFEWSEENAKLVKSAYELFAEKEWNDIESGFSSLGF